MRTDQEWQAVVFDEQVVRPAAEDLAGRLGLTGAGLRRYPGGSRPVYAVGDRRVLKLYPTVSAPDCVTEARVLEYLNGRLPVATPELLAHGEYENGWRYVLMSQLPGTELAAAWPAIPRPHRDRIASQAGEMLAALHGLDAGPLDAIIGPADWAGFLAGQRATATKRQRQVKLADPWLSQIDGFLESAPLTPGQQRVLLHTEVIREHLVVNPGRWTLSGLLDFERAMTGDRAYEFAAAGLFVSYGDPRLLGRILAAYGRSFDPRELLAYTLLHRHSNLPECLAELAAPAEPTLDSLAHTWFGTA
ncbi:MAG TPA: aminoglycoside phosphotransferase family protein [Streptosporangiaceae bacterium]|nr:aminoglycoside phosphotransferase family protein [Streptosporangiaceae bacterium]